jgi:hypothetical protein
MKYEEKAKIKFSPYFFHADTTELNGIPTPDFAIITENRKFSFVEVKFRRLDLDNSIELFTREAEKIVDIWDCYVVLITKDLLLDLAMEYNYFTVFNKVASGSNGYEVGSLLKHEDWKINKEAVKECEEIIKKINFD